ncbi:hypothetical protein DFJ77DRAFT_266421 [Powellomyces hirtus]|nr:hypothetical protein DFJ77DRAFT_266421 [Powellomyces hirtus]
MRVVVTGATGFLGSLVVNRLLEEGLVHPIGPSARSCSPADIQVVALGRNRTKGQKLADAGAIFIAVDLVDRQAATAGVGQAEIVFHCAAKCEIVGRWEEFVAANVTATENVVHACIANNVAMLVHVSTPSVYTSTRSRLDLTEDQAMPLKQQINFYSRTKLMSEHAVLSALKSKGLNKAAIIRPRGLIGPGDTTLIPRFVSRMRGGSLPLVAGGKGYTDITFVGNVVDSLLCAATVGDDAVNGKIYNITNGEPIRVVSLLDRIGERIGLRPKKRYVPFWVAFCVGRLMEILWRVFRLRNEPTLTRYVACVLGRSLTLNIEAAKKDLNYKPRVSIEEGLRLAIDTL